MSAPQPFAFLFFSDLKGAEVVDSSGNVVGKVWDITMVPSEIYPKAVEFVMKSGWIRPAFAYVPWSDVAECGRHLRLRIPGKQIKFGPPKEARVEISLLKDVLDQQVVDTYNRRVVRVNDIHLLKVERNLMLAHVDVGVRGMVRRLGYRRLLDAVVALFPRRAAALKKDNFISWKYVQILSVNPSNRTLKVALPFAQFSSLHPVELSDILTDLDPEEKSVLFKALDIETKAKVFANMDGATQQFLIQGMDGPELARLISMLPSDEAADFMEQIPKEMVDQLLGRLDMKQAKKLSTMLGYAGDEAGGLMTTEYLAVPETCTVREVLDRIRTSPLLGEMNYYVYIVDAQHHLLGSTTLKRLLSAGPDDTVAKSVLPKTTSVLVTDDVKQVAILIERYRLYALPVVNEEKILQGIITVDDILEHLIALVWRDQSPL